ncbi:OmpP1/FadL family transporter [Methylophaga lonarensis]|uniref:OmpP1/FadL family transporter n=1 Tax=Methylophaga lonarensis TaxID=999151 RepID=UPI003D271157
MFIRHQLSVLFVVATSFSVTVQAAGFANQQQSITHLGRAYAGAAAITEDASGMFFNPAGMTQLQDSEISVGLNYIAPDIRFRNRNSRLPDGTAIRGGSGGNGSETPIAPNVYLAHRLNDKVVLGLGIGSPFGLATDYRTNWQGRYHALRSDLMTVNFNPAIAIKANDRLSLGFGINVQYIDLELSQAIDFGSSPLGSLPQQQDGRVKINANDWGVGFNLGMTYELTEITRLGLAYRSSISHRLKGKGRFRLPDDLSGGLQAAGFNNARVNGKVRLPETFSVAVHHQFAPDWAISADATWTRWSRYQTLAIDSANPRLSSEQAQNWKNSMRYGLGLTHQFNDAWTFRTGVAFDQTPVPDSARRNPRTPDSDRTWLSVGASYQFNEQIVIDAGFAHVMGRQVNIRQSNANGYILDGRYRTTINIASLQLRWQFD